MSEALLFRQALLKPDESWGRARLSSDWVRAFFVPVSLALRRFGVPADLAFLIVALFVIAAGAIALISGLRGLKPSRLAPSKSISQISSLLGELQDGADVR